MVINPIQYDLATLCMDRVKESFPIVNCALREDEDEFLNRRAVLKIGTVANLSTTTSISIFIVYFYEDYAEMYAPWAKHVREVSYMDPKFMDILLSEMRLAW